MPDGYEKSSGMFLRNLGIMRPAYVWIPFQYLYIYICAYYVHIKNYIYLLYTYLYIYIITYLFFICIFQDLIGISTW